MTDVNVVAKRIAELSGEYSYDIEADDFAKALEPELRAYAAEVKREVVRDINKHLVKAYNETFSESELRNLLLPTAKEGQP